MEEKKSLTSANRCFGIDLGTTNTSVATCYRDTQDRIVLEEQDIRQMEDLETNDFVPKKLLSSIIFVDKDGSISVGNEARLLKEQYLITGDMDENVGFRENIKENIGSDKKVHIGRKEMSPVEVDAEYLSYIKKRCMKDYNDYNVVITVPANFGQNELLNTKAAAIKAGWREDQIYIYEEPKAAILSFLHEEATTPDRKRIDLDSGDKTIMVVDIGGGTCDVIVENVQKVKDPNTQKDKYKFALQAVGRENLGGVDFDRDIAQYLVDKYDIQKGKTAEEEQRLDESLKYYASLIKEQGTKVINGGIQKIGYEPNEYYKEEFWLEKIGVASKQTYARTSDMGIYEISIKDYVDIFDKRIYSNGSQSASNAEEIKDKANLQDIIDNTLKNGVNGPIDISKIDYIFLTGGMSLSFPIRAGLYDIYHKDIISPSDPFLAVSNGAALFSQYVTEDIESYNILQYSIMVEKYDGSLQTVVPSNTKVPSQGVVGVVNGVGVPEIFKTVSRNGVLLRFFTGKNEYDWELEKLNRQYIKEFDNPMANDREFKIHYTIDINKIAHFSIEFLDNGECFDIDCKQKEE